MNTETENAGSSPVERRVRPVAWRAVGGTIWGHKGSDDDTPLYDQAALAAAVSAERERCAKLCEQTDEDGEGPDCWGWHAKDYARAIRSWPNVEFSGVPA